MRALPHEIRFALRLMRRRPGVTAAAILTLGVGIGANTAVFSVVNSVLLQPLPYASSDRLVFVSLAFNTGFGERTSLPMADFIAWRESNSACSAIAAYSGVETVAVSNGREAQAVLGTAATAGFFDVFGVTAAVGRVWRAGDDEPGAPATVVVSHGYWSSRLDSDPGVIGRTLRIDGQPFTIIGVAPQGFAFPSRRTELWSILPASTPSRRGPFFLRAVGLMRPASTIQQVQVDLARAAETLNQTFPIQSTPKYRTEFLKDVITGDARPALLLLFGAAIVVMLIAVVNVANLLIAQAAERQREMAVRAAVGAARGRILRQLFVEGLMLALAGAAAGWTFAVGGTRALVAAAPASLPRMTEIGPNIRVLWFTLAVAAASALLLPFLPHCISSTTRAPRRCREACGHRDIPPRDAFGMPSPSEKWHSR
jgi:predicted permease